ncbi:threo-3-hydroxy-L-aspartate ammonia-lyase [Kineosporia mesophila]|uniref:Threo-3-hydroxy-L-aspartate ammonia-lyase n=1 Tax=Kineosporia mesophila TaxID=566012 RepID=A0ABP6Z5I2_9ACTN|nr:threo-3-hydroxy-L-aspartate ammonia-lyase [Kineosporia mesophila]MCD5351165.1 threo-3-hydroxy-L-aspartate ammonia-lyase [Kineosporia mesophila]
MSVSYSDVEAAAERIAGVVHRTPVMTSRRIDDQAGAQIFLKCENLQRAGAFKIRGAYNTLARLDGAQRRAGVVAYSSGNHSQAVALAASILGMSATIVMPHDTPASKLAATQGYGAHVVHYDRYTEDRAAIAQALAVEKGLTVVPPFDDPSVIAGQGTAAKELLEDVDGLDAVFAPLGGGGLLAGTALSVRALAPAARVYGVEPEAGDDGAQSFRSGEIVTIAAPRTIADGAQTTALGGHTFPIIASLVTDVLTATDAELIDSMRLLAGSAKLVVEPTGALGLAAALRLAQGELAGRRIGVVLSGGNVDLDRYASFIGRG